MEILILVNFSIFILISALHFYWAFGGAWASRAVLPERTDGTKLFIPGKFATILVASGLLLFALIMLVNLRSAWQEIIGTHGIELATWLIIIVFATRAMGDFKYIGFSKRIKYTVFARYDSYLYSPLCLFITVVTLLIVLNNPFDFL